MMAKDNVVIHAQGFSMIQPMRNSGVTRNIWTLPSGQSLYLAADGPVVSLGAPLVTGTADVAPFDREALIKALRTDEAGNSTFPEFLEASWRAGVVRYEVDFFARTVSYYGCSGQSVEDYPTTALL
jgi:uncharacterized protein YbcV (DUF1398 family)